MTIEPPSDRHRAQASYPEDHPMFRGPLGMSVKTISDRLTGHDLAVVIGAEV